MRMSRHLYDLHQLMDIFFHYPTCFPIRMNRLAIFAAANGNALSCPTKEIQSAINKLMEEKYA